MALDHGNVRDAGGNRCNLRAGNLRVCRLSAAEAYLDLDFVTVLEEPSRGAHADLEVVLVGARSQAHLFYFRDMLVLLRIPSAFVLFKSESAQVGDTTHWRIGGGSDLDQVEAGFFGAAQRLVDANNAKLLAPFVDDAYLGDADL